MRNEECLVTRLLLLAWICVAPACAPARDRTDGTVVVLVWDGVRAGESLGDGFSEATGEPSADFVPRIWDEIVPLGVRGNHLWNLGTTTTAPAHVELASGLRQVYGNYAVEGGVGLYRPDLPMLPEVLSDVEGDGGGGVVLLANTEFLLPLSASLWPWAEAYDPTNEVLTTGGPDSPFASDRSVLEEVRRRLEDDQPRLLVANLHAVDRAGHYGDRDAYLDAVRGLDDPIADLHAWIRDTEALADDTWFLLLTDHGRHTHADTDPVWRNHGCSCNGCRHIAFVLTGPGVARGRVWSEPVTLADLGATLATFLGVDLPFAEGVPVLGLLDDPPSAPGRSGVVDLAEAGGHRAEEVRVEGDARHRSEIVLDGAPVSTPGVFAAEHPVLASDGERSWLCFREVVLTPEAPDTAWQARCLEEEGGTWTDIGGPVADPGPFWDPVLLPDGTGRVHLVHVVNPNGTATGGKDGALGPVTVDVGTWDGAAWTVSTFTPKASFPTDADAVLHGDGILVATGASPASLRGRHHRDIYRLPASPGAESSWRFGTFEPVNLGSTLAGGGAWRMERPALTVGVDRVVRLAAVGVTEGGARAVLAARGERDTAWGDARIADLPGPVLAHVQPVWVGDRAVFAVLDGDEALLCAVGWDVEATCAGTGSPRIRTIVRVAGGIEAVVDEGTGQWGMLPVAAAEVGAIP